MLCTRKEATIEFILTVFYDFYGAMLSGYQTMYHLRREHYRALVHRCACLSLGRGLAGSQGANLWCWAHRIG